jgi:8-oxo-dGTP pyrophosphatase MutT (NUDIX family)
VSKEIESAKTAIVNSSGEILVLRRTRLQKHRRGGLDWPGGKINTNKLEFPEAAAWRETIEETGLVLDCLHYLGEYRGRYRTSHFFAAVLPSPSHIHLSREHSAFEWVPIESYPQLPLPAKYIRAVVDNMSVFDDLIHNAADIEPVVSAIA